ncbi:MAG: hypothetical protein J3Q66DRAFT_440387 [Benniella sp.]|nr:MAG: hypothetical protein J3Q66DRAFT_440387 [Benniella sp.]
MSQPASVTDLLDYITQRLEQPLKEKDQGAESAGAADPKQEEREHGDEDPRQRGNYLCIQAPAWCQAFSAQALHLCCLQDPKNSLLPSKPSVILNKALEVIRLNKLCKDGWTNPFMADNLSNEQFQQLGRYLFSPPWCCADGIQFMPIVNVLFLSKFAAQLPASWYSDEFLRTTILLAKKQWSGDVKEQETFISHHRRRRALPNLSEYKKLDALDCSLLATLLTDYILQPTKGALPVERGS